MFIDKNKADKMRAFLSNEHFRYSRLPDATCKDGEIDVSEGWSLDVNAPETPLIVALKTDFNRFLNECMDVRFQDKSGRPIRFVLTGEDDRAEAFTLIVDSDLVEISAPGERGLLRGAHHLERLMADRCAPYLKPGKQEIKPKFSPRISQTIFTLADGSIPDTANGEPELFSDEYLSLMSHYGVNGLHIYLKLWEYSKNEVIQELNSADYAKNIALLQDLCNRASVYGIDIYTVVNNRGVTADSPVFLNHPETRGSLLNYPTPDDRYSLCSGNEKVLRYYSEAFANITHDVPKLAGFIFLVGGEGFLHCFTRPKHRCPNSTGVNPSEEVANMVNTIGASVHAESTTTKVFAWPYSAFTWSGPGDPYQEEFVRHLSSDVELLSTFETPYAHRIGDRVAVMPDYNITNIGPSEQFAAQSRVLSEYGKKHYAKFECTTDPGWFFMPYIPVHYRWVDRARILNTAQVPGYVCQWRFYGFNGSMPEEILHKLSWNPGADADSLLMNIAKRDFGQVSPEILTGWRIISDAWAKIPISHSVWGEREFYMKGPIHLGPSHPLILNPSKRYGLSWKFFTLRGDCIELFTPEQIAEAEKDAPPRYSMDLAMVYPYGTDALLGAFEVALAEWTEGTDIVRRALGSSPNNRAKMELGLCEIVGVHLRTAINLIRFYSQRDDLFITPGDAETLREKGRMLMRIVDDEIQNAREGLALVEQDFRIGFGYCYGQVYDEEMIREKISQCEYVRDSELPDMISNMLFHNYNIYEP